MPVVKAACALRFGPNLRRRHQTNKNNGAMLRYMDTQVVFREVPNEITLAVNISGCPHRCPGCHSPWLWEDAGEPITEEALSALIAGNPGITCVALMGGDADPDAMARLFLWLSCAYPGLRSCWYTGRTLEEAEPYVGPAGPDYLKVGPYVAEKGPLDDPRTNQRMYRVTPEAGSCFGVELEDITPLFWKKNPVIEGNTT